MYDKTIFQNKEKGDKPRIQHSVFFVFFFKGDGEGGRQGEGRGKEHRG